MRKICTLLGLCFFYISAVAQISTDEQPVSFGLPVDVFKERKVDVKTMPRLDMDRIQEEDERDEQDGLPPRFGYPHKVNFNLTKSGSWTSLPTGTGYGN